MHPDAYAALAQACSAELRVKGSRFLALCQPVRSESEAALFRRDAAARHPDASHHCWALRLGHPDRTLCRDSDAGEPGGSAGPPIARALQASGLSDILCIVIRWFGGTKLGKGGLIRAYGESAREALAGASVAERLVRVKLAGSFDYEHEPALRALLSRLDGRLLENRHDERVHWVLALPPSALSEYERAASDLLRGRSVFHQTADPHQD